MTINERIRDEKLQHDINKEAAKLSALLSGIIIEQGKFSYSPSGEAFEKQS